MYVSSPPATEIWVRLLKMQCTSMQVSRRVLFRQDESFLLIPATKGMEIRTTALFNYFHFVRKYGEVNDLNSRYEEDGIHKGIQNVCLLTPVRKRGAGTFPQRT